MLEFDILQRDTAGLETLGKNLHTLFAFYEILRRPSELQWIEDFRQYKGFYDPEELSRMDAEMSKTFPKITRSKVNGVLSRLNEMLFPDKDKNWMLDPTPVSTINPKIALAIAQTLTKVDPKTNEKILPTKEEFELGVKAFCKQACKRMEEEIDDQLVETDYPEKAKGTLKSGIILGTGVLKGVMTDKVNSNSYMINDKTGEYEAKTIQKEIPYIERTLLWHFYPDMRVTDLKDSQGDFELHLMTKHDLRKLMKRPDFDKEAIATYLREHKDGNTKPKNWMNDLATVDLEGDTAMKTESGDYIRMIQTGTFKGSVYEVLEFWGIIDGEDLAKAGYIVDAEDVESEFEVEIWLLGDKIIKVEPNGTSLKKRPWKVFYYEKDESSIFGEGLPRVMRNSQSAMGASARMILDNAAISSGPQLEINWNLLSPGLAKDSLSKVFPRKIWWREGKGMDANYPAVRVYNVDSHVDELTKIFQLFKDIGDEECTLPSWIVQQPVTNETVGGGSMRMSSITVSLKDIVKNFDMFTEEILESFYAWNMDNNPETTIKGDYKVKAIGSSSLVLKEIRMNSMNMFAQTLQPEDWIYLKRREFILERVKLNDINADLVRTEEEAQAYSKSLEDKRMKELQYALQEAEVRYTNAKSASMVTKAKDNLANASAKNKQGEEDETGGTVATGSSVGKNSATKKPVKRK